MCRSVLRRATTILLVVSGFVFSALAQECPGTVGSPHLTDRSLDEAYSSCTSVEGDVTIGVADCSFECNLTSLSPLARLHTISGSLTIHCCYLLEEINGLSALTSLIGTLRIYYNQQLHTINGFEVLRNAGNVEISQNNNLTRIVGLSALEEIEGHLEIDRNPNLLELDGLSGLRNIRGGDLVSGHALNIIYNTALLDLRWLRNLTQIGFGTVHIEGNLKQCYAGYPQWSVGEFNARPPAGDKGIDWRTVLSPGVPLWQYSWGVENGGYPTLVIQNNAAYDDCEGASCHDTCVGGAGCLGPMDPSLCGTCYEGLCEIGATPTSSSCDPTPIPYWPPVEMPYSLLFGILFAFCGLLLLCLVLLGVWVMCRVCKRIRAGRNGSFDIQGELEMVGMELRHRDGQEIGTVSREDSSSLHHSSIIAQSSRSTETQMSGSRSQRGGNVVLTSSSYRSTPTSADDVSVNHSPSTNVTTITMSPPHSTTQSIITTTSTLSTANNETTTTTSSAAVVTTAALPARLSHSELQGSLNSIPEEIEDEMDGEAVKMNEEGPSKKKETDLAVRDTPRRRLYKHDTLTRLQKGESAHVQMTFPRSQLKLKKEIGNGDFGTVFFAEAKRLTAGEKKTPVIVKQLKENSSKQEQENFLRPVEAMSLLQHPNVLSLLGACVDGPPVMILMEYCSHGNLKTHLVRKRRESVMFKESGKMMTAACHMAAGLTYLHSNSIAHNDFAVRSCLVSSNEVVKLGDYGLTKHIFKEDYYSRGGRQKAWPVRWMAPEQMIIKAKTVLDSQPASTTGNVWSFGIALWEVGTLAQWPYFDLSNEEVIDTVQSSWQCTLENPFQPSDQLSSLYDIMQSCWKPASERPTMLDVLHRLEELRDDIARNTPTSYRKRKIMRSSPSNSPKTTPTGTPIVPHPKPASRVTQTGTPPTNTRDVQQSATKKRRGGKGYSPRRPAPKIPDDGSLKRGTTMKTSQVLNDPSQHPLEKSVKAQTEKQSSVAPQDVHPVKDEATGTVTSSTNPLFANMEAISHADEDVKEEDDVKEGMLFVNRSAKEEDEMERFGDRGKEAETGNAWEDDEEDDDFILEPPEDFSQTSMDKDSPSLPLAGIVDPHDLYNPSESQCTSIDDFEPSFELPPSPEPSPEEVQRSIPAQAPLHTHRDDTAGLHNNRHKKRKKRRGDNDHGRMNSDRMLPPLMSYQDQTEITGKNVSTAENIGGAGREMEIERGWNEPDFADDDSRYRRPTSRIKALLKRAPSWGRSGKEDGTGEDDIPNVVYDDDVSALIW